MNSFLFLAKEKAISLPASGRGEERDSRVLFFFLKSLFIHEKHRERQRHRQRKKQAPYREPDAGPNARIPGL